MDRGNNYVWHDTNESILFIRRRQILSQSTVIMDMESIDGIWVTQTINHKWNNRHIEIVSYKDNDNDRGRGRSIHLSSSIIRENGDGLPGKYIMDIESCRISRPSLSGDPIYIYDFPQKLIKLFNQWSIQETRILSRILSPYMARNMMDDTWIIIWRYWNQCQCQEWNDTIRHDGQWQHTDVPVSMLHHHHRIITMLTRPESMFQKKRASSYGGSITITITVTITTGDPCGTVPSHCRCVGSCGYLSINGFCKMEGCSMVSGSWWLTV